jgi:hypothetical protein
MSEEGLSLLSIYAKQNHLALSNWHLLQMCVKAHIKERSGGETLSMIYLIHCKNLCKCHNVPPTQHKNKGKKRIF